MRNLINNNQAQILGLIVKHIQVLRDEQCVSTEGWVYPTNGEWNFIVPKIKEEIEQFGLKRYPIGNGKLNSLFSYDKKRCLLNSKSKQFQIIVEFYDYFSEKRERNEKRKAIAEYEKIKNFSGHLLSYTGGESWGYRDRDCIKEYNLYEFKNGKLISSKLLYYENSSYSSGDLAYGCPSSYKHAYNGCFESIGQMFDWLDESIVKYEKYENYTRDNGEHEAHESTLGRKQLVEQILLSQINK